MDIDYTWRFRFRSDRILIHMELNRGAKQFDASLSLEKRPFSYGLAAPFLQYPFMTLKVVVSIYWQALRLWLKRVLFHTSRTR